MDKKYQTFLSHLRSLNWRQLKCIPLTLALTLLFTTAFAQINITGLVKDSNGHSIPGVSIQLKNTKTGTVTGSDGKYQIAVPSTQTILIFTSIGFNPQEVVVGSGTVLNIILADQDNTLDEVVMVGYGQQKKETVTGAISTIKTADLLKSSAANITNALTGRLPGLTTIQASGRPGFDEAKLLIRGQSTWVNSNPLIIVDGMERESLSQIDPNEVETISILKDASATAVYGVRGANGVVLVTTRRGKIGKPVISFTQNTSLQKPSRIPETLGSYDQAVLLNMALKNDGKAIRFTDEQVHKFKDASDPYGYPDVNWWKEFTKPHSLQNQSNLNMSGGTERVKYFTSLGYINQNGMFKYTDVQKDYNTNTDFSRINFRSNLDITINKYQELSAYLSGRIEDRNGFGTNSSGTYLNSLHQLFQGINSTPPYIFPIFNPDGSIGGVSGYANPYRSIVYSGFNNERLTSYDVVLKLNNKLDFITEGLSALLNVSTNSKFASNKAYTESVASYQYLPASGGYNQISENSPLAWAGEDLNTVGYRQLNVQGQVNYSRRFGDHNINAMAVYNQLKSESGSAIPSALIGTAARVAYGYKSRYNAEFNLGYNGSENFAPGHRFGVFPAYSLSWNISEEDFIKRNLTAISLLKLRGSYGLVGNDKVGGARFLYQSMYGSLGTNQFFQFGTTNPGSAGGITEARQGNPDLRWETATKRNLGLDLEMFNSKLGLTLDIFDEKRKDILMEARSFALVQGGPLPTLNIGRVNNKGYEISMRYRNTAFEDLNYNVVGNLSYAKNKVINRDDPGQMPVYQKLAGYSINQQRGYQVLGFFQSKEEILKSPSQVGLGGPIIPGDLKYFDYNGDNKIDTEDMAPIGYSDVPQYTFSTQLGLEFKGISLNVMFQGAANSSVMYIGFGGFEFNGSGGNGQATPIHLEHWTPENPINAKYPSLHTEGGHSNKKVNTFHLRSGNFVRLKNVELGYALPKNMISKLKLSNVRIYLNGDNLYTWSKTGNFDPEALGGSGEVYPVQSVYNLGINVSF